MLNPFEQPENRISAEGGGDGAAVGAKVGVFGFGEVEDEFFHLDEAEGVAGFDGHFAGTGDPDLLAGGHEAAGDGALDEFVDEVSQDSKGVLVADGGGDAADARRCDSSRSCCNCSATAAAAAGPLPDGSSDHARRRAGRGHSGQGTKVRKKKKGFSVLRFSFSSSDTREREQQEAEGRLRLFTHALFFSRARFSSLALSLSLALSRTLSHSLCLRAISRFIMPVLVSRLF